MSNPKRLTRWCDGPVAELAGRVGRPSESLPAREARAPLMARKLRASSAKFRPVCGEPTKAQEHRDDHRLVFRNRKKIRYYKEVAQWGFETPGG
jgi:hypothetical protein